MAVQPWQALYQPWQKGVDTSVTKPGLHPITMVMAFVNPLREYWSGHGERLTDIQETGHPLYLVVDPIDSLWRILMALTWESIILTLNTFPHKSIHIPLPQTSLYKPYKYGYYQAGHHWRPFRTCLSIAYIRGRREQLHPPVPILSSQGLLQRVLIPLNV